MDEIEVRRPLFITGDDRVESELLKLAVAADTRAWRAVDARTARRYWNSASAVVIAADAARGCADARLPERDNVVLLTGDELPYDQAWPLALTMGADQVASLPVAAAWLTGRLTPSNARPARATVVTVTGARGGVGTSAIAAAAALKAADSGRTTLLVDGDPRGGGLDLTLGWENREGLRWPDLHDMPEPFDPAQLRSRLPGDGGLGVLSFSRDRTAVLDPPTASSIVDCAARAHDLMIIDAPRYGDPWLTDTIAGSDLLALVVPGEVRAVAAARHVIAGHAGQCDRVRLIVRSPSPGHLSTTDVVDAIGVPLAGELRTDSRIAAATESGALTTRYRHGTLSSTAAALLACLEPQPKSEPAPTGARQ